jgi:hypothetical protein
MKRSTFIWILFSPTTWIVKFRVYLECSLEKQSTTARNFIEAFAGKGSAGGIVGYENSVSLPDYSLSLSFDVYPSSG